MTARGASEIVRSTQSGACSGHGHVGSRCDVFSTALPMIRRGRKVAGMTEREPSDVQAHKGWMRDAAVDYTGLAG